jgi:flagellar biosynthesis repressor protein FlbT
MALRLTLRPNERVVIADAVVRNGGARAVLHIENEVPVLRESDILRPSDVKTPCERIVLAIQLMYVDGGNALQHRATFDTLIDDVRAAAPSLDPTLDAVAHLVDEGRLYQALKQARRLITREREILSHAA